MQKPDTIADIFPAVDIDRKKIRRLSCRQPEEHLKAGVGPGPAERFCFRHVKIAAAAGGKNLLAMRILFRHKWE